MDSVNVLLGMKVWDVSSLSNVLIDVQEEGHVSMGSAIVNLDIMEMTVHKT